MHKVITGLLNSEDTANIAKEYPLHVTRVFNRDVWYVSQFLGVLKNKYRVEYKLNIEYVSNQPYNNADDMRTDFWDNGHLAISTQFNNPSKLMTTITNLVFRTVHDIHHCLTNDCNFILDGEICAYNLMRKDLNHYSKNNPYNRLDIIHKLLFMEIVGQVCYFRHNREFPVQVSSIGAKYAAQAMKIISEAYDKGE